MRIRLIRYLINGLFSLIILHLVFMQIVKGNYYKGLSENNRIRLVPIEASRGTIYDRNGLKIVEDRLSFDVCIIPQEFREQDEIFVELSKILNVSPLELQHNYRNGLYAPFAPVVIAKDIDAQKAHIIEENHFQLPGVSVQTRPLRHYLYDKAASHVLGYLGRIDPQELERFKPYGYTIRDWVGKDGLEKAFDRYLKGVDGGMQIEVDNRGRMINMLSWKTPVRGTDIYLTLDIRLQNFIHNLLIDKVGAVVVTDPRTGEILALESSPSFNPNIFIDPNEDERVRRLLNSKSRPFINRAISAAYPPGSVFKPVLAVAALQENRIDKETTFFCSGSLELGRQNFNCWKEEGHGPLDLHRGIMYSCNVYFYNLGRRLGPDLIAEYASKFGYGKKTQIELYGESNGLVPSKKWKRRVYRLPWYEGDTLNYSIGQGYILATPIQVLNMVVAIANGGYLPKPYVVKSISSQSASRPSFISTELDSQVLKVLKNAMRAVVADASATGYTAHIEGLDIAGKTGTAQVEYKVSHAWFACFAPVENPKVAMVVFLEHGGKGGQEAARIAREILQEMLNEKMI